MFNEIPDTFERDGFTFRARIEPNDTTPPWKREDGHGPVIERTTRDKVPGELVLSRNRLGTSHRYYDFAKACRIARRDGWGLSGQYHASETRTARQRAALAAREDFERMRRWCDDDWSYVGVVVTVEARGVQLASDSLWGIESDASEYLVQVANECAQNAMEEARVGAVQFVRAGDRIQFKASCDHRAQWRVVTGWCNGRPTVRHRGYRDFVVRPEEVRAVQFTTSVGE